MRPGIPFLLLFSLSASAADGKSIFDRKSLRGWVSEGEAKWMVRDGVIASNGGGYGWLRYDKVLKDFALHVEFRTAADGNSGIFLRATAAKPPHESGYELQIFNTHPKFPTGSLVNHILADKVEFRANEWEALDIEARGKHFIVKLNGRKILEGDDTKSVEGWIGLQHNPNKEIEFRNIRLKLLPAH
jgi:hypothetical protein